MYKNEGLRRLFSGATTATSRAVLMTVGQLSFYDQVKMMLLASGIFEDNLLTHFLSSLSAVSRNMIFMHNLTDVKYRLIYSRAL